MIELTPEQVMALDQETKPIRVVDPRTKTTYTLVREEVYQKMEALLEDEIDMVAVGILVNEAMREDDENDPTLEYYQQMYGKKS